MKEKAVTAALELAATQGWDKTGLSDIAERAAIPLHELRDLFEDRFDILAAWGRMIDTSVLEDFTPGAQDNPRERLFEIIMARLDVLQDHRDGARAILRSFKYDPKQAIISLPHLCRSMSWMLEACGIETTGLRGVAKIAGLNFVYLRTLWAWCEDDSADLSKTMAALDQALGRAENWAQNFGIAA